MVEQEQWEKLREPFPPEAIGAKPKQNKDGSVTYLDYVGHAEVTERLNDVDPTWTLEAFGVDEDGAPLIQERDGVLSLWANMTVLGVTRLAVGTVKADAWSGETSKELISDAIRNGAMRFGVALDLWKKRPGGDTQQSEARPAAGAPAQQQSARTVSDPSGPITSGQSKNLWRLRKYVLNLSDIDYYEAILIASGIETTDDRILSQREAGKVISYLKEQAGEEDTMKPVAAESAAPPPDDSLFDSEPF